MGEDDFPDVMAHIANFLDLDYLDFVVTEKRWVVMDGKVDWD